MPSTTTKPLSVRRSPVRVLPDPRRVIARAFFPGDDARTDSVLDRVFALPEEAVEGVLAKVRANFNTRHRGIERIFDENFRRAAHRLDGHPLTEDRKQLIGAFFTMEYSLESVALFNPSIVSHPDQSGLAQDSLRFIMSLRACGEGHVSSIEFRTGVLDGKNDVHLDPITPYATTEQPVSDKLYDKPRFFRKLSEMGV